MRPKHTLTTVIAAFVCAPVFAMQDEDSLPGEILVLGSDFVLPAASQSATEGTVFDTQLQLRPVSRTAELLEFVPGLIATQHSGEGKANQYFVRGFNLDHGTDFLVSLDNMPINMPSHGHGQGYADINFIIPELIDRLTYRKGPYYADGGDFATAGSADFRYTNRLDEGLLNLTLGENDYRRLFAGQSFDTFDGSLTMAGAVTRYAGPWEQDQNLNKRKGLIKYHRDTPDHAWSLTGMTYHNNWDATDQIPLRAVQNGSLNRLGNIDNSVGGNSKRSSLSLDWREKLDAESDWRFSGYLMNYDLDLYSNFTYFANDPVRGDQFQQTDNRTVIGFDTEYQGTLQTATPAKYRIGLQHRYDDIDVGLHLTDRRQRHESIRDDQVEQSLSSLYGSLEHQWSDRFRSVTSLRADHYRYNVLASIAANSGDGTDTLISPKLNLIFNPTDKLETYIGAGQGFHSNDARGATISIDPVSGENIEAVDPLATARSFELGMRTTLLPKTTIAVSAFTMRLSSELVYVGDEGTTEALDGSQRRGVEVSALFTPTSWLLLDGDVTYTRARMRDVGEDNRIPNAVGTTASLGMIISDLNGWSGGFRARYLGAAPLTEARQPRSQSTFLMNAQTTYQVSATVSVSLELNNVFNSSDRDITYYYESQLPGEAEVVEDIHFHPVEPRNLRLTLQARF